MGLINMRIYERDAERFTLDETPPGPFHLCRDDDTRRDGTRPHETCSRLDYEHASARNVWRFGAREHHHRVLKVAVHRFVVNLAFRLSGTDAIIERLDVRHVALEKLGSLANRCPV